MPRKIQLTDRLVKLGDSEYQNLFPAVRYNDITTDEGVTSGTYEPVFPRLTHTNIGKALILESGSEGAFKFGYTDKLSKFDTVVFANQFTGEELEAYVDNVDRKAYFFANDSHFKFNDNGELDIRTSEADIGGVVSREYLVTNTVYDPKMEEIDDKFVSIDGDIANLSLTLSNSVADLTKLVNDTNSELSAKVKECEAGTSEVAAELARRFDFLENEKQDKLFIDSESGLYWDENHLDPSGKKELRVKVDGVTINIDPITKRIQAASAIKEGIATYLTDYTDPITNANYKEVNVAVDNNTIMVNADGKLEAQALTAGEAIEYSGAAPNQVINVKRALEGSIKLDAGSNGLYVDEVKVAQKIETDSNNGDYTAAQAIANAIAKDTTAGGAVESLTAGVVASDTSLEMLATGLKGNDTASKTLTESVTESLIGSTSLTKSLAEALADGKTIKADTLNGKLIVNHDATIKEDATTGAIGVDLAGITDDISDLIIANHIKDIATGIRDEATGVANSAITDGILKSDANVKKIAEAIFDPANKTDAVSVDTNGNATVNVDAKTIKVGTGTNEDKLVADYKEYKKGVSGFGAFRIDDDLTDATNYDKVYVKYDGRVTDATCAVPTVTGGDPAKATLTTDWYKVPETRPVIPTPGTGAVLTPATLIVDDDDLVVKDVNITAKSGEYAIGPDGKPTPLYLVGSDTGHFSSLIPPGCGAYYDSVAKAWVNNQLETRVDVEDKIASQLGTLRSRNETDPTKEPERKYFISEAELQAAWPASSGVKKNDYAFVAIQDASGNYSYNRYKFVEGDDTLADGWYYEYMVGGTTYTAAQLAALDSGINAVIVSNTTGHIATQAGNPHRVKLSELADLSATQAGNLADIASADPTTIAALTKPLATSISAASTNDQIPSAKAVYDLAETKILDTTEIAGNWDDDEKVPTAKAISEAFKPLQAKVDSNTTSPLTTEAETVISRVYQDSEGKLTFVREKAASSVIGGPGIDITKPAGTTTPVITADLATNPGLEFIGTGNSGKLSVKLANLSGTTYESGLKLTSTGLTFVPNTNKGLKLDTTGASVKVDSDTLTAATDCPTISFNANGELASSISFKETTGIGQLTARVVVLTQAEYDALPATKTSDGVIYLIKTV